MKLPVNVSGIDRIIRVVLALVLVALSLAQVITGTAAIIAVVVGVVLLLTAFVSFCPIYALLHLSTKRS
jgi:hypothetical protein